MPTSGDLKLAHTTPLTELTRTLQRTDTRLVVLSACNSGYWTVVEPLLKAGVPAVIGINGGIASTSSIKFGTRCTNRSPWVYRWTKRSAAPASP